MPSALRIFGALLPLALLLLAMKNRGHGGCVHDSKILIAVVEDRICALDALLLQIAEPFGERLELPFRIQIFKLLGRRNVAFEPLFVVLAMKANIDLVAGSFDNDGTIELSSGASIEM